MKSRILLMVATAALALSGLVAVQTQPASAHAYDNLAAWTCGATRPNGTWTVKHANPVYLTPDLVEEKCIAGLYGHTDIEWWAVYVFPDPGVAAYIYRASPYYDCPPGCPET